MLVGPCASDDVASDLNPLGRPFSPAFLRTPAALSQDAGAPGHRVPDKE
jgi:hypothetical protein